MALTADEILKQLNSASNGGKTTEIYNAIRDFKFDFDASKLGGLSDQQLLDLRKAQTGGTADLKGITRQLSRNNTRARSSLIKDISSYGSNIQRLVARGLREPNADLTGDVTNFLNAGLAFDQFGLSNKSFEEQFTGLANLNAADFAARDRTGQTLALGTNQALAQPVTPLNGSTIAPTVAGAQTATVPFKEGLSAEQQSGIQGLVDSGRAFTETDAKNYAYATGRSDWQNLVGKTGAQIMGGGSTMQTGARKLGPTEYESLRNQFGATPENFDKFFTRVGSDIYLKPDAFDQAKFSSGGVGETVDAGGLGNGDSFLGLYESGLASGAPPASAFVTATISSIDQLLEAAKGEKQRRLEAKQSSLISEAETAATALEGKGAAQLELEEDLGVPQMLKDMKQLRLRISQRASEFAAGEVKILDQAIPAEIMYGQAATLQNQKATEIGALSSALAAISGNFDLARDYAKSTIDLMFFDEEQKLANTRMFLEINEGQLSKEEAKQASKVEFVLGERERILGEKKEEKQQIMDMMLQAAENGFDPTTFDVNKSLEENIIANKDVLAQINQLVSSSSRRSSNRSSSSGDFILPSSGLEDKGDLIQKNGLYYDPETGSQVFPNPPEIQEYVNNIKSGLINLDDVPQKMRNAVATALNNEGYDEAYNQTLAALQEYQNADYTREEIEQLYEESGGVPPEVVQALDQLYGPATEEEGWWSRTWNNVKNWFNTSLGPPV